MNKLQKETKSESNFHVFPSTKQTTATRFAAMAGKPTTKPTTKMKASAEEEQKQLSILMSKNKYIYYIMNDIHTGAKIV